MVKGLETFRKAMAPYKEHFVIIGGTAVVIDDIPAALAEDSIDVRIRHYE